MFYTRVKQTKKTHTSTFIPSAKIFTTPHYDMQDEYDPAEPSPAALFDRSNYAPPQDMCLPARIKYAQAIVHARAVRLALLDTHQLTAVECHLNSVLRILQTVLIEQQSTVQAAEFECARLMSRSMQQQETLEHKLKQQRSILHNIWSSILVDIGRAGKTARKFHKGLRNMFTDGAIHSQIQQFDQKSPTPMRHYCARRELDALYSLPLLQADSLGDSVRALPAPTRRKLENRICHVFAMYNSFARSLYE